MISYIDAHAHHQQSSLADAEAIVRLAIDAGIQKIGLGGTDPSDWKAQVQLHHRFSSHLFLNFGLHPWWVEKYSRLEIESILAQLDAELPLVHGLGETGLDFYQYEGSYKLDSSRFEDQRFVFRAQVRLALKHQKPIVLHVVDAHEEAMKILVEEGAAKVPLILHRFSGNAEHLKEYSKLGAYFSFHEAKKLMKDVPLSRLLLETDSNQKQHPGGWDIRPHYQKTAEMLNLSISELVERVGQNFNTVFHAPVQ